MSLLLLGGASAASAAPASPTAGWTCDGDVCLKQVAEGDVTTLDDDGCNYSTCVLYVGGPGFYTAVGSSDEDDDPWYGHVDLWGPGMPKHGTGDRQSPSTSGTGRGVGNVCAQGWKSLGGGRYESIGLPCVSVG